MLIHHKVLGVIVSIALAMGLTLPSQASDDPFKDAMNNAISNLESSKSTLQTSDAWQIEDMESYLYNALSAIYLAKAEANRTFDPSVIQETNADLHALVNLGFLPYWPGDPLNDWEPLQQVDSAADFVPNALVVEPCPSSYNTTISGQSCALSVNIYINAPDTTLSHLGGSLSILSENREWACPPKYALYALSFYAQSDNNRAEIRAKYEQAQQEKASEEQE